MTNKVFSNAGFCPEDHTDVKGIECQPSCLIGETRSNSPVTDESETSTKIPEESTKHQESNKNENDGDKIQKSQQHESIYRNRSKTLSSHGNELRGLRSEESNENYIDRQDIIRPLSIRNQYFLNSPKRKKRNTDKAQNSSTNTSIGETIYDYDKSVFYDTRDLPIVRHPYGSDKVRCVPLNQSNCEPERIVFKAHGPQTGMCVNSDR